MTTPTLRHAVACCCLLLATALPLRAQPAPPDDAAAQQAELKMLRATVDRQAREIRQLHEELDALRAGRTPTSLATTQPAPTTRPAPAAASQARRPDANSRKRVVFLIEARGNVFAAREILTNEVARAINELKPEDSFNILYASYAGAFSFQKQMANATDANKQQAIEQLRKFNYYGAEDKHLLAAVKSALQLQPTTLWLIADGRDARNPAFWADLQRLNDPSTGRTPAVINTASFTGPPNEPFFNLAHNNNGICIDRSGAILDHPTPNAAPPPKTPDPLPTGPSIFDAH